MRACYSVVLYIFSQSGSFVEHAVQASKKMLPKQMLLLGNSYIYKYTRGPSFTNNVCFNKLGFILSICLIRYTIKAIYRPRRFF